MRSRLLIPILAFLGGCTTITAPPPVVAPTDYSSYFWQSGQNYTYVSGATTHAVTVSNGPGALSIADESSGGGSTTITAMLSNNQFDLKGFTPGDLFGFDNSIQFVSDTNVIIAPSIAVRSIAALGGKLFAASDQALFEYDIPNDTLIQVNTLPPGMTLYGDEINGLLYAVEFGGTNIWASDNGGATWANKYVIPPPGISAVTADDPKDDGDKDMLWVASGADLLRISQGSVTPSKERNFGSQIVALNHMQQRSIIVGLVNGDVSDLQHRGPGPGNTRRVPGLQSLAGWLAGSAAGVFQIQFGGNPTMVQQGIVNAMYATPLGVYAGVGSELWRFPPFPYPKSSCNGPEASKSISQIALTINTPDTALFVLEGSQIYRYQYVSPTVANWPPVNQNSGPALLPKQGAFTLLSNSSPWSAGYIVQKNSGVRHFYVDSVKLLSYAQQVILDSVSYNDVMIFRYTAYSGSNANTTTIPQYTIYFRRGFGPIRIEKTLGTTTDTIRLAR